MPFGPTVVVLGGTHGDEISGIEVVRRLLKRLELLDTEPSTVIRSDIVGKLIIGFGNPEAIIRSTQSASTGLDLNRSFARGELHALPFPFPIEPISAAPENLRRCSRKRISFSTFTVPVLHRFRLFASGITAPNTAISIATFP